MITLIGCVKPDDLPSLDLEPSTPHLAFPLLQAQLTTDDLVAEVEGKTAISINEEGVFHIVFDADPVIRSKADVFPKTAFGLPVPILDSVVQVPVPSIAEADIDSAVFKGDSLNFILNSFESGDVTVDLVIPEIGRGGMPLLLQYLIPFSGGGTNTLITPKIPLSGYELSLASGFLNLRYDARNADGNRIILPLSFAQIDAFDFSYLQGQIGTTVFNTGLQSIPVDVQDTLIDGTYQFTNPRIHFDISNSFGMPIGIAAKEVVLVTSSGEIHDITSTLFEDITIISHPGIDDVGGNRVDRITFDRDNSNIVDIAQNDIAEINYDIDIIVNPFSLPDRDFFVTDSSAVRVDAKVDLSFEATVQEISLKQGLQVMLEKLDSISSLRLKFVLRNGMPLLFDPEIFLLNDLQADTIVLTAESAGLILPASTDESGNVVDVQESVIYYNIPEDLLLRLRDQTEMVLALTMQSPESGQKPAIVKPDQVLEVFIGAEARLK
ncbi:MAG: hypothetical protein HKN87_11200 [Saprospiraceae bacterium]|nr:hypothetical protein [Saprospiraceae bacterium]